jgi:tight adherence protein B
MLVRTVDRAVQNQNFALKLRNALARADMKFTVAEYLIIWLAVFVGCIFLGQVVFRTLIHTVVLGVVGLIGPRWYLRYRAGKRLKAFNNALADTIVMMANSLRSGYSMLQSMEMLSREMSPPISTEFNRVIKEVGIGLSPEEALANLVRRIKSVDLEIMVMAINVQREIGGNLSIILDTIAHTIRERVRIRGEIKTLTAQATLSGYIISALPLGLAGVLYTIDSKYISFFWNDHTCGLPLMGISLFMMTVGFFIMKKITNIEV